MVTFLWILFDAAITARMMVSGYPEWEIVLWGLGGLILAGYAWYVEDCGNKAHATEIAGLNGKLAEIEKSQTFQSGRMDAITGLLGPDVTKKLAEALSINLAQPPGQLAQAISKELGAAFEELRSQNEQLERTLGEVKLLIAKPESDQKLLAELREQLVLTLTPQELMYRQQQARLERTRGMRMRAIVTALNLSTPPVASTATMETKVIKAGEKKNGA